MPYFAGSCRTSTQAFRQQTQCLHKAAHVADSTDASSARDQAEGALMPAAVADQRLDRACPRMVIHIGGGYYSTPFYRWQGSIQYDDSIQLGASTARRWFLERKIDPAMLDYMYFGSTVSQHVFKTTLVLPIKRFQGMGRRSSTEVMVSPISSH
jgi:hypothetical protein